MLHSKSYNNQKTNYQKSMIIKDSRKRMRIYNKAISYELTQAGHKLEKFALVV